MPLLIELPVPVGVLQRDAVAHGKLHQCLVEQQLSLFAQLLQFAQRHALRPCALNDLLDAKGAVLLRPPLHEFLRVVGVVAKGPHVVLALQDVGVEVVVNLHHVQHSPVEHLQSAFVHELFVLLPHRQRKL